MAANIRKRQLCLLMNEHTTTCEVILTKKKKSNLNLIKLLDLTTNLQETQGTEERAKLHNRNTISKMSTLGKQNE